MARRVYRSMKAAGRRLGVVNPNAKYCYIYLFRHGQSYWNKKMIFTGWKDSKLTPLGIRQAKKVGRMLKDRRIDVSFRTRLSRSKDTLKEVMRFHPECRLIVEDDRMIERDYGKVAGLSKYKYKRDHGDKAYWALRRGYKTGPPGGETFQMIEKRVFPFIKDLLAFMRKHKVNVGLSAHGNSMRPFRRHFGKLTIKQMCKLENPWDNYFRYKVKV